MSKRCQIVKKMSNVKKSNIWTVQEVHRKNKVTQSGSQILMSILMSHMKVIKTGQKYFLLTFLKVFGHHHMSHQNWCQYVFTSTSLCQLIFCEPYPWSIGLIFWHLTSYCDILSFRSRWGTWWTFVVISWIICNFINTAWILRKNLLDIDIDVFYPNIQWFFSMMALN